MADWLNSIAVKTQEFNISIDIFNDAISPKTCQARSLLAWNEEYRLLIEKVLENEGFQKDFIASANMDFQITSRKGQNNIVNCTVTLVDENGKIYKNKKLIKEEAYEKPFEPFSPIEK